MSNRDFNRNEFFVLVSGFDKDTDRSVFKNQFEQFGIIKKIFIENTGKYAKIYFDNKVSCTAALQSLVYNPFNWKVEFVPDRDQMKLLEYNCSRESEIMDDEEDFTEKSGYCTIHGQPLVVLQADSGDLYVKLKDIRRAGFTVFRKDTFSHLLVDRDQINKEFELHLLSEAKNYILKNKVATIDEDQILKTIERCKSKLVGENSPNSSLVLTPGRSVVPTSDNNFVITTDLRNSNDGRNGSTNTSDFIQRPPKTLSTNFMNFMATNKPAQDNQHARSQPTGTQNIGNQASGLCHSTNRASSSQSFNKENRQMNGLNEDLVGPPKSTGRMSYVNSSDHSNHKRKSKVNTEVENLSSMSLIPGNCYQVKVCFIESEKICWVQENNSSLDTMTLELFQVESSLEVLENPRMGQLVIAFYEELWYRARIINEEPLSVHYLDYGNKSKPELVKLLPEKYKKIPAMACRMVINHKDQPTILSDGLELKVRISKQYADGTYLCQLLEKIESDQSYSPPNTKLFQASEERIEKISPQTPKLDVLDKKPGAEKNYFDIPSPLAELEDGQMVIINGLLDDKLLVKTKDCCRKSKELIDYIKKLDKSTLTMASVKKKQLVLCSKDGMVGLYRATVIEKDNEMFVTVKYIDYPGEDQLSVKSLRNVDEHLAKQPALLIETPICEGLVDAVPAALDFVGQLIEDKTKMTVVLSSDGFDLKLEDGKLLSEELDNIRKPKRVMAEAPKLKPVVTEEEDKLDTSKKADVETKSNKITQKIENIVRECEPSCSKQQKQEIECRTGKKQDEPSTATKKEVYVPVVFDDMDWIKAEVGKHDYICYTINDLSDVTLISLEQDSLSFMEEVSMLDLIDNVPFKPDLMEMCMVSYKTPEENTASWYRAVVLSVDGEELTLLCVDFGNQITVKKNSIRKFSEDMKCIPILGISCVCIGIPHNDKVLDSVKKYIPEGAQVKVDIKEYSEAELKYKIEFPEIYDLLRKDGLCN